MSRTYSRRLSEIQPFKVMKLLARANALERSGRQIVHMEVGEPDFPTPGPIVAAGERALEQGATRYTPAEGILELRQQISRLYQNQYKLAVPASRIFVTAGGSGALLLAAALTMDSGDGLLMTDPGYPCNRHILKSFGGDGHLVPVTPRQNYQLTAGLIDEHWRSSTKGVLLASPANPTGAIVNQVELTRIAEVIERKQGHLIVDEIYHGLHYTDQPLTTALQVTDQAIVVNSFSKYFGMTGWRLGWLVVPEEAVPLVEKLAQNLFICASSIAQHAALGGFTEVAMIEMESNRLEFRQRRDYLVGSLRELGFNIPLVPEGAFYIYAGIPKGFADSEAFCDRLLEEYDVAVTPGTDFGFHEANLHVRFSYAQSQDVLARGIDNLRRALK
ncbi:MAG: aminotransferase class I/II-fold pyridoxal phosphate-dependent enzyme [bacterium]